MQRVPRPDPRPRRPRVPIALVKPPADHALIRLLKGKMPLEEGQESAWHDFAEIEVTAGKLWSGDPAILDVEDGYAHPLPNGTYIVAATVVQSEGHRHVGRLRAHLATQRGFQRGARVGENGTDSGMIGVGDIAALGTMGDVNADTLETRLEAATTGLGVLAFGKDKRIQVAFVPTGSDGTGPVYELLHGETAVGVELSFMGEMA